MTTFILHQAVFMVLRKRSQYERDFNVLHSFKLSKLLNENETVCNYP